MPEIIHCSKCNYAIHAENFADGMSKLRRHYKKHHLVAFRKSIKKAVETRKKR